ncbi:MAG: WapI family immunity protein [Thermoanaerobaculia bacterium]
MIEIERTSGDPSNPYDWWLSCSVEVQAETWRGVLQARFLQAELRKFADDLDKAAASVGNDVSVEFSPIECGVCLTLTMNDRGQIFGEFSFSDTFHGPGAPRLEGSFGADQTYLAPLASQLRDLLAG